MLVKFHQLEWILIILVVCGSDEISIDDTPYGVQPALDACNTGLLHVGIKLGVMLSMLGENQSSNWNHVITKKCYR